jgi:hypothetical protein
MPLSCSCDYDGGVAWHYYPPGDYTPARASGARRRCSSCKTLIQYCEPTAVFECSRPAQSDIEEMIYGEGEEIPIADKRLCERCADLYFSFVELGYECIAPDENMIDLAKEYGETHNV